MLRFRLAHVAIVMIFCLSTQQPAAAISPSDASKLPDNPAVEQMAKDLVDKAYLDALISKAAVLKDYQCFCGMMSLKNNKWKDFGGVNLYYKKHELLRAEVVSSDYRNGSVIVKQADGKIRGKGGGGLAGLVKVTMQPNARSIQLPTGFSLVNSDFHSLYNALKVQCQTGGIEATISAKTNLPAFKEPVQVLCIKKTGEGLLHVIYLNPETKIPIVWNTFSNGQSSAIANFEKLNINQGLSDDLFQL
jgi:hypothetical protein